MSLQWTLIFLDESAAREGDGHKGGKKRVRRPEDQCQMGCVTLVNSLLLPWRRGVFISVYLGGAPRSHALTLTLNFVPSDSLNWSSQSRFFFFSLSQPFFLCDQIGTQQLFHSYISLFYLLCRFLWPPYPSHTTAALFSEINSASEFKFRHAQ